MHELNFAVSFEVNCFGFRGSFVGFEYIKRIILFWDIYVTLHGFLHLSYTSIHYEHISIYESLIWLKKKAFDFGLVLF